MAERPEVTVHFAQTLDGHIDRPTARESEVISNDEGFALAHQRRASHDAVLVGIRTVLKDDPKLTVTRVSGNNPHRVVLDSRLRTPTHARLLERVGDERVVIFTRSDHGSPRALVDLRARGAEVVLLRGTRSGLVDISSALAWLREAGVNKLLVEGGAQTIGSFLSEGAVDRLSVEVAPWFLGRSGLPALGAFPGALRLDRVTVEPLGDHVLVSGVPVAQ